MKRLLKYCLILVFIFILLGMVVPLGLFAHKYTSIGNLVGNHESDYAALSNPNENKLMLGSVLSIAIFNLAACVMLFLQQFFWFKINKKEQFPVPVKLTKKYSYVGYMAAALIVLNICWSSIAFAIPIDNGNPKNDCYTRIWIYGAGLIVNSIFTFSIMGYSEYINLQIIYNQNIQMVDEGVANGTYDPVTRMPYDGLNNESESKDDESYENITIPDLPTDESENLSNAELDKE